MSRQILTIAAYTLLEAFRNRLLWLILVVLVGGLGLDEFIGGIALTGSLGIKSAFLGGFLRLFAVFLLSLFVITSLVREMQDKGLHLLLSMPLPRSHYYFGKLLGFSLFALLITLLSLICLLLYVPAGQALLWAGSLYCELLLVAAFSLLCLFTFSQVTIALCTVGAFYLLSRSIAAFQLMGHGPLVDRHDLAQRLITAMIDTLAYLLPDLARFTPTDWLVYHGGQWQDLLPIMTQTLIYLLLIMAASLFDLYRKSL